MSHPRPWPLLLLCACAADAPEAASPADATPVADAAPDTTVAFDGGTEPELPYTPEGDAPEWDPDACDLRWTYTRPEGGLPSALSVDAKGKVYAAGAGVLHRIGPTGLSDWAWPPSPAELLLPGDQLTGAAINAYGTTVVLGGASGRVYAVTHLGGTKWTWDAGSPIRGVPALAEPDLPLAPLGGLVAVVTDAGELFMLRDEGASAVPMATAVDVGAPGVAPAGVAILDDGTLRVRTEGRLTAVTPQGGVLWTWTPGPGDGLVAGPAVAQDGTVRAVLGHGRQTGAQYDAFGVVAWTSDGGLLPERATPLQDDVVYGLVTGPDDSLVLTARSRVVALPADGEPLWTAIGDYAPAAPPALAASPAGALAIVGAAPHTVLVLEGGTVRWRHELEGELAVGAPVVGDDGATYLHMGAHIVALDCGAAGPAASRWPRHLGTARSAGRPAPSPAPEPSP